MSYCLFMNLWIQMSLVLPLPASIIKVIGRGSTFDASNKLNEYNILGREHILTADSTCVLLLDIRFVL